MAQRRVETARSVVRLVSQAHHRSQLPVHTRAMTERSQQFTASELERMLDWYRALPLCHNVVARDDELADKIALRIAQLRANPARPPL